MQKQAPSFFQMATIVGFALSCFGLLLYLWVTFGGPTPLAARGYVMKVPFTEASLLAKQSDVRISGVSVGKVTANRARRRGQRDRDDRARQHLRPGPGGLAGDPAPEDAAGRDLR